MSSSNMNGNNSSNAEKANNEKTVARRLSDYHIKTFLAVLSINIIVMLLATFTAPLITNGFNNLFQVFRWERVFFYTMTLAGLTPLNYIMSPSDSWMLDHNTYIASSNTGAILILNYIVWTSVAMLSNAWGW